MNEIKSSKLESNAQAESREVEEEDE
jgi:hypothetical protein